MCFLSIFSDKPQCELDYDSAQNSLSWRIFFADGIDQKPLETWVKPYLREEALGIANLQRQHRLMKVYKEETQKWKEAEDEPLHERERLYNIAKKLWEELHALRTEYWSHRDRLYDLEFTGPDKIVIDQTMIPRQHRDRYHRPFSWTQNRANCASRGGCCGRGCRCCEKALDAYILSRNKCHERAAVYGHCTGECACCIDTKGRYVKHAGLPVTEF